MCEVYEQDQDVNSGAQQLQGLPSLEPQDQVTQHHSTLLFLIEGTVTGGNKESFLGDNLNMNVFADLAW